MSEKSAVAGRMREYIDELRKVVERTLMLEEKALRSGDDGYWAGGMFYGFRKRTAGFCQFSRNVGEIILER